MDTPLELFLTLEGGHRVIVLHRQHYTSKFTHGDFSPRNVLVKTDGMVMAISDWDGAAHAGGFPNAGSTQKLISCLMDPMTGCQSAER